MAYCNQTLSGINLDCTSSVGGIKTVYIANYGDVEGITLDTDENTVTGITLKDGAKFKTYQFRRGTSNMTSTLTADETTGNNFVTTDINLVFTKLDTAKRIEMAALSVGQLIVIVLDNNGVYHLVGGDDYVSAVAGGAETGTAKTDRSAYTLTLRTESKSYPMQITSVDGIIE